MRRISILLLWVLLPLAARAQSDTVSVRMVSADSLVQVMRLVSGNSLFIARAQDDPATYSLEAPRAQFLDQALHKLIAAGYTVTEWEGSLYIIHGHSLHTSMSPDWFKVARPQQAEAAGLEQNVAATYLNKVYEIGDEKHLRKGGKAVIHGYIRDKATSEPVVGITVYDDKSMTYAMTDSYGFWRMLVPTGDNHLNFSGYPMEDVRLEVKVYEDGGLDIEMSEKVVALKAASISAEILTLHLTAADGQPLRGLQSPEVFVSRPGHPEDLYAARLQEDGKARFFTSNFFGPGDMVVAMKKGAPAFKVEVESPYRQLDPGTIPALVLDPSRSEALTRLGARMQVTSAFDSDTLYQRLPARQIAFLSDKSTRYILDDYTRFATLREVFVEYLSDIRPRGRGDDLELQVRSFKREGAGMVFRDDPSLILVDGVPVFNHNLVYNLDPALVKSVEVYPYYTTFGQLMYSGVANFVTFKGDMGGIRFGDNVRILDYSGAAYPVAFTTPSEDLRYPSQRETLLWQPLVELQAGEELVLPALQAEEGMVLVAEGLTESGEPVLVTKLL